MERPFSTSRVIGSSLPFFLLYLASPLSELSLTSVKTQLDNITVEYFDPHDVYKLVAPGLVPRLPLRDLHWRSPSRPLRSIHTLHVELVPSGTDLAAFLATPSTSPNTQLPGQTRRESSAGRDDGFQTAPVGGQPGSTEHVDSISSNLRPSSLGRERRHQIPGLRRTPYLKVLFVRCDDNDVYKSHTRPEIRDWIKTQTTSSASAKKSGSSDNHDASEWLIVHVVIPNTVAASQPRVSGGKTGSDSNSDVNRSSSAASRWRGGSSTLLEKLRSDFNVSGKNAVDRIAQIRIGINDVPYDVLPRVVPAVPSGYQETPQDAENSWADLIGKVKNLILSSFDMRVTQYEDDIREKDAQRVLPGWNFCTFFILKEGLARGFESVGLVEDALVGYDELAVGLDSIIQEQAIAGSAEAHGGSLLSYTEELKVLAQKATAQIASGRMEFEDEEAVNLQPVEDAIASQLRDTPISPTKKPYRDLILANNVSVFDFRCYIFARQVALLLRLGNAATATQPQESPESILHGVAPKAPPPPMPVDDSENLSKLAEICRRTLEFIPAVSQVMRRDIISALGKTPETQSTTAPEEKEEGGGDSLSNSSSLDPTLSETVDNMVASFAFSVAQQTLTQTSTKALPIPPSTLTPSDAQEPKAAIPEPKTMMHPARSSSLHTPRSATRATSPNIFSQGRRASVPEADAVTSQFLKTGLEELAARKAELYTLCRNLLEECGKKRGWSDGWDSVPIVGSLGTDAFEDISLDSGGAPGSEPASGSPHPTALTSLAGIEHELLRTALENRKDFYRLYEGLTDKALRHYTVANHIHSVQANMVDLGVLKFHLEDYASAAYFFCHTTPSYGKNGWSLLEISMLVMYSRCLQKLQQREDHVKVLLKLLSTAASAEIDRIKQHSVPRPTAPNAAREYPEKSEISGFLSDLLEVSSSLGKEIRAPLANFFCHVEIDNIPAYDQGQDSFSLTLSLRSVFVDEFEAQSAGLRLISPEAGGHKEIWLRSEQPVVIRPGRNRISLQSKTAVPGEYEVQQLFISAGKFTTYLDRGFGQPVDKTLTVLKNPRVILHQRAGRLDVRLRPARETQLDRNNSLDLEVVTGWNEIKNCEIRIKSATAGMRLMMSDANISGEHQPARPPEGGFFVFDSVPAESSISIQFPFTVEQDHIVDVSVRVEISYTTERGTFTFAKTPSVHIALALGVNVQDVFKHNALFSRFTVSTATSSPLRLFKSELQSSDLFSSQYGVAPSEAVTIFSKQPASLLYRVTRREGVAAGSKTKKTMYLKLYYSVLYDEIEEQVRKSLEGALQSADLWEYSPLVTSTVSSQLRSALSGSDLERSALLGELSTSFLSEVHWTKHFVGLGKSGDADVASSLADVLIAWQREHPTLPVLQQEPTSVDTRLIIIPVDIPSIRVVHTADIRIQKHDTSSILVDPGAGTSAVCTNQLLPATLHLKWTRMWDTGDTGSRTSKASKAMSEDLEFSYEVTAPTDTWLLGGRRKGHFVIPALPGLDHGSTPATGRGLSSTPDTEADIPLILSPLREGWLPYPHVEIRQVRTGPGGAIDERDAGASSAAGGRGHGHCETDHRNLGETVRVIGDRKAITLSLDSSGPGGAPLVLETERLGLGGRVVA